METALSPTPSSASQACEQEARLAVELLRTSRVVLLFGPANPERTVFLRRALMGRLHRRASDLVAPAGVPPRELPEIAPIPERRVSASTPGRELVVYFDDWCAAPLAALRGRIYSAAACSVADRASPPARLADMLALLGSRHDAGFLVMLDRFEDFPLESMPQDDVTRFADELAEAINRERLPANFLISIAESAAAKLAVLRARIPGFDDYSLKLDSAALVRPAPVTQPDSQVPPVGRAKSKECTPAAPPIKTEDVYALIESRLTYTAEVPYADSDADARLPATPLCDAPTSDASPNPVEAPADEERETGWAAVFARIRRRWRKP